MPRQELMLWADLGQLLSDLPLSINRSLLLLLYNENGKLSIHLVTCGTGFVSGSQLMHTSCRINVCKTPALSNWIISPKSTISCQNSSLAHEPLALHDLLRSWKQEKRWLKALPWVPISVSLSNVTVRPTGHLATLWEYLIIPGKCCVLLLWHWWAKPRKTQRLIWKANSQRFAHFSFLPLPVEPFHKKFSVVCLLLWSLFSQTPPNLAGYRKQWNNNKKIICKIPTNHHLVTCLELVHSHTSLEKQSLKVW